MIMSREDGRNIQRGYYQAVVRNKQQKSFQKKLQKQFGNHKPKPLFEVKSSTKEKGIKKEEYEKVVGVKFQVFDESTTKQTSENNTEATEVKKQRQRHDLAWYYKKEGIIHIHPCILSKIEEREIKIPEEIPVEPREDFKERIKVQSEQINRYFYAKAQVKDYLDGNREIIIPGNLFTTNIPNEYEIRKTIRFQELSLENQKEIRKAKRRVHDFKKDIRLELLNNDEEFIKYILPYMLLCVEKCFKEQIKHLTALNKKEKDRYAQLQQKLRILFKG